MRASELYSRIHAEPFLPFTIHMANGRTVHVNHPEWIMLTPAHDTAIVVEQDGSIRIIDVDLVLEIQHGPPVQAGSVAPDPDGEH
jgi:hypothetical protein